MPSAIGVERTRVQGLPRSREIDVVNGVQMKRTRTSLVALGLAACLALGLAVAVGAFRPTAARASAGASQTTITVTMTEYKFKLSKSKNIPLGTVVFKLVNKGKIPHDFKIAGKTSKLIAPGKTGSLTVHFTKKGSYAYICAVFGHAKLGMKGTLAVATAVVTPPPTTTATTTTPAAVCASPVATTITVSEFEFGFTLSQTTVPCGTVTFVMTNSGTVTHNFILSGTVPASAGVGPTLNPGQSASMTASVVPGSLDYLCSIPGHAESGMKGTLTVTG
jgi:uncharacterized cupredoxin-like copper-binding protein